MTRQTIGDLLDAILAVGSPDEAHEFMVAYRAENDHADANVGYLAGYCDIDTAKRIWDWFGCAHPVLAVSVPVPEDAFRAGKEGPS